ncbi:MAG: YfhO family protein [Spirochaetia bacterium]|nr:YfhO family protein [Spirochaetia bacterium]
MIEKPTSQYSLFTILFLIFSFLVYWSFIFSGTTFINGGDGFKQHFIALTYYGDYLRTLLSGKVPQWDFNIGEGADILQTFNYYVIGDPFALLSVFFPAKYMYICYNIISLLKIYCAGCAFIFMCRRFRLKQQAGVLVAALSYTFSAWAFIHSAKHPFFINPMIYMPLIIAGLDMLLKEKKPVLFTVAVAVAGISNGYYFYMIALLTAIYVLALLIYTYQSDFKTICSKILLVFVFAVVGTLMASGILLPVANFFFSDSRTGGFIFNLFYNPQYYIKMPMTFLVPEDVGYFMWISLSAVALVALVSLFFKKGNGFLKILVIISVVFFLFPFFGQVLNKLSYQSQRWCWAFVLLSCYILALQWDDLCALKSRVWLITGVLILGYFVLFNLVYPEKMHRAISFVNTATFFLIWLVFWRTEDLKIRHITISAVALFAIVINANYQFCIVRSFKTGIKPERIKVLTDNEATAIKKLGDSGFYRFSGNKLTENINVLSGLSSPQYYWSLTNSNISEYRKSLGRENNFGYHVYCDYDSRAMLEALAGVKYYCTSNSVKIPFGFEKTNIKGIYKSSYYLPFGYTYNSFILRDDFEKYSEFEKQQILMQSIVLDNPADFKEEKHFSFSGWTVPYTIESDKSIEVEKGRFIVKKENASLKLKFEGLENSETYLYFKNLDFKGKGEFFLFKYSYYRTPIYLSSIREKNRELRLCQPRNDFYVDIHTFLLNEGYSADPLNEIVLTFDKKGTYSFDDLAVCCQSFEEFPSQIENLRQDSWTDVHFGTNRVYGTVDFSDDKLLLISIPYGKGWTAFVDGKKTQLLRGNIMNLALPMEKGKHSIELVYATPLLKEGLIVSIMTIVLFFIFVQRKRKQ